MLEHLFPHRRRFFAGLDQAAESVSDAASLLHEGFDAPSRWSDRVAAIRRGVGESRRLAHELATDADRMLIPPLDREDIQLLLTGLQRVGDFIEGTARRVVSLRVVERQESAVALASTLLGATRELAAAVAHLNDGEGVLDRCRAVKQAEEAGDAIWQQAISVLFAGTPDPLAVIRWKTVYDQLEDTLDACDDVANELETIIVKHM